ncbi:hypothetical protein [Halocatena marina]|uniref:hypothetical protein n=1 Tax=Halocatena marina TaxID=2934937 RepID=UPI00200DC1B2|nr:hypothetical protein [Halocatena marina]
MTAQRDANVRVAGDGASYLSLQPSDGPNGAYATQRSGQLRVSLAGSLTESGAGVNRQSLTVVKNVFTISNQGSQPLGVWITDSSGPVTFEGGEERRTLEGKEQAVTLQSGESVSVGLTVDTRQTVNETLIKKVEIHADSDVSGGAVGGKEDDKNSTEHISKSPSTSDDRDNSSLSQREKFNGINKNNGGKIDDLVNLINRNYEIIKKHRDELKQAAQLVPGPIDDLLVWMLLHPEKVQNFSLGGALGAAGMPSGETPVDAADSLSYFVGWMAGSFVPIFDIVADARDTAQALANKDAVGTTLGLAAILPGVGKYGDVGQLGVYTSRWVKFSGKSGKVRNAVKSGVLSHLSDKAKRKILDGLIDNGGKLSVTRGISESEMQRYIDAGYDRAKINDLTKSDSFTDSDIRSFTAKGVNLDRVKTLRNRKIPAEDVRYYVKNDVSLHKVTNLRNQQFSPEQIRKFTDKGVDTRTVTGLKRKGFSNQDINLYVEKDVDLNRVNQLKYQGFTSDEVSHFVKQGDRSYFKRVDPNKRDGSRLGSGATLRQVGKLKSQGIPKDDITYYVDNGVSLKLVGFLREKGSSSGKIRKFFLGSPNKVKRRIKEAKRAQDHVVPWMTIAVNAHNWCSVKKKRNESVPICP